jgi:hypothetical protein
MSKHWQISYVFYQFKEIVSRDWKGLQMVSLDREKVYSISGSHLFYLIPFAVKTDKRPEITVTKGNYISARDKNTRLSPGLRHPRENFSSHIPSPWKSTTTLENLQRGSALFLLFYNWFYNQKKNTSHASEFLYKRKIFQD